MSSCKLKSSILSVESFLMHAADDGLALIDGKHRISRSALISEILNLACNISANSEQNWALACNSTTAFTKGLFALLAAGKTVCLPANLQPGTLTEISRHTENLLSDSSGEGFAGQCYQFDQLHKDNNQVPLQLKLSDACLIFFTSGSAGQPKAIKKYLWQLEREINAHQAMWGEYCAGFGYSFLRCPSTYLWRIVPDSLAAAGTAPD